MVVTSVIQRVPLVGNLLYEYVVGGLSLSVFTLYRVFSLHV